MKTDPNAPAFPCGYHPDGNSADQVGGLTKRELGAFMIAAGICARAGCSTRLRDVSNNAIAQADDLLAALGEDGK